MTQDLRGKRRPPKYPEVNIPSECPRCKSSHVTRYGLWTIAGSKKCQRMKCMGCGYIWIDGEVLSPKP